MKNKNLLLALFCLLLFGAGSLEAQVTVKTNQIDIKSSSSAPFSNIVLNFDSETATNYDISLDGQENFAISETNVGTRIMIKKGGNIGIGVLDPLTKLDVDGDIQLRGDRLTFFTNGVDTRNIFIGDVAGDNVTTGCCSTVLGIQAGGAITDANSNTLVGNRAGNLVTGNENTLIGTLAGTNTGTGIGNVFVGSQAGQTNTTGTDNVSLGRQAGPNAIALNNSASIGTFAASNASFKMQLGSSTTTLSTSGGYTIVSDGRFKKDLKNDIEGLDFIMNLKPVSYRFDYQQYDDFLRGEKGSADLPTEYKQQLQEKSQLREVGFIAQEVAETSDATGVPFNGVYRPQNDQDNYALDYGRLTVPLVKATQEQQAEIEALQQENEALKERLAKLEGLVQQLASGSGKVDISSQTSTLTDAKLEQNQPNPFNGLTTVRYFIPESIKKAVLRITNIQGKVVKEVVIQARGEGQTTFDATTLSNGTYQYSLFLDGQLLETKQMVLTKN